MTSLEADKEHFAAMVVLSGVISSLKELETAFIRIGNTVLAAEISEKIGEIEFAKGIARRAFQAVLKEGGERHE